VREFYGAVRVARRSCCGSPSRSSPTSRCRGAAGSALRPAVGLLSTAWQAVADAAIPDGGSVTVLGIGPIGRHGGADDRSAASSP